MGMNFNRNKNNLELVFAHDAFFRRDDERVYSVASFPDTVWRRYLSYFMSITVLARDGSDHLDEKFACVRSDASGVEFSLFPSVRDIAIKGSFSRDFKLIKKRIACSDAVIARLPSEMGLLAIRIARHLKKPYAVEVVGCPWDGFWNYGNWKGMLYAPVMVARTRRAVAQAPFALYVTKEFLQRRYPNRNGRTVACSDVEISEPSRDVLDQRLQKIERQERPIVLGLIGTLKTRFKGIQTVLEALGKIRTQLPSIEFRVLGGGDPSPWKKEAEQYGVGDLVIFEGTLPAGKQVFNWLDYVDIYLQPSFKEGLPRALIEAMSRGCPAIGSNCAGIPELLDEECLIKPGDANHLAKLILQMAEDKEWQKKQALRNWEAAREYDRYRLKARRNAFWKEFAEYAESRKKGEKESASIA